MKFTNALLAFGFLATVSGKALAQAPSSDAAVNFMISTLEEADRTVAELQAQLGAPSGGFIPTPDPTAPATDPVVPGDEDCTFCDESATDESPASDLAFKYLLGSSGSFKLSQKHLLASLTATSASDRNFNFAFGCSYQGDGALDLTSADFALGYPTNQKPQWRNKVDASLTKLDDASTSAGCP